MLEIANVNINAISICTKDKELNTWDILQYNENVYFQLISMAWFYIPPLSPFNDKEL